MNNFTFNMNDTGKRISKLRRNSDMTQVELADKLNISYQAVSNWERGESMPDISKLPELAMIFGVSIDEILGSAGQAKIVEKVSCGKISEVSIDENIRTDDIVKTAHLLKPTQIDKLVKECKNGFDIGELCSIAPFVSQEVLDEVALKICENGEVGELCAIAPFISKKALSELVEKVCKISNADIGDLCSIAPFIGKKTLGNIVEKICENRSVDISELCAIAPFIKQDILDVIVMKICEKDGISELCAVAPFVSRKTMSELAYKAAKKDGLGSIMHIMSFVDLEEV
ncbi:MAG: helix-turn-helix domain-containing protein [Oscillospiraceae bacterium]|nr:helix-turn-helix domain-containing protein [Oscillospiraceae bacterium]